MGLSISHSAFNGAYGVFTLWRNALVTAAGIPLKTVARPYGPSTYADIDWDSYTGKNTYGKWGKNPPKDPLYHIIVHSDADGKIKHKYLLDIVVRLIELLPELTRPEEFWYPRDGHRAKTIQFINGALEAYLQGEDLVFS